MTPQEIISKLSEMLDQATFKKGFIDIIDGPMYKAVLRGLYEVIDASEPQISAELLQLASRFIEKDALGMFDEAGDLLAEIAKKIYMVKHNSRKMKD